MLSLAYRRLKKSNIEFYIWKKHRVLSHDLLRTIGSGKIDDQHLRIIYSIMIFEDYNRPYYFRILERAVFCLYKTFDKDLVMSLGIMQVRTSKMITDFESIILGAAKIEQSIKKYDNLKLKEEDLVKKIAFDYNPSIMYAEEVLKIFSVLKKDCQGNTDLFPSFEANAPHLKRTKQLFPRRILSWYGKGNYQKSNFRSGYFLKKHVRNSAST